MVRIGQLKLHPNHTEEDLIKKIMKVLRINEEQFKGYTIRKQSVDARRKNEIMFVYTIDVSIHKEEHVVKRLRDKNVQLVKEQKYRFLTSGTKPLIKRPVIIGSGPAGLFCAYMLSISGYQPILLERGGNVEERMKDVEDFWDSGIFNPESNVQFGEGGAGTFSDGKLNTLVKDPFGRNQKVLEILVENGAPEEILYVSKPHIGTDLLTNVVKNMREKMIAAGCEVRFHSKVTNIVVENNQLIQLEVNNKEILDVNQVVLAIGHSARDTFEMLYEKNISLEAKSFAVGIRIEHPQDMINEAQYGKKELDSLPVASYKLTSQLESGRGVYSFCMCPGGFVIDASSEKGKLAVNGMSYNDRSGKNANSAIVVTVSPVDFNNDHPLAGIEFQRELEEKAFAVGNGKIPVQCFGDFCDNTPSTSIGDIIPQIKGAYELTNIRSIFPEDISAAIEAGIKNFDTKIKGFARKDSILSAIESRTSSPVRIIRDSQYESNVKGLYPCGEGAGYAGGITSAAMDGIKVAEAIAMDFQPYKH